MAFDKRGWTRLALLITLIVFGCGERGDSGGIESPTQSLAGQQKYEISLALPPGATLENTVLHATTKIRIEHETEIRGQSTTWPVVVNLGSGHTLVGHGAELGDILSQGPVFLDDHVKVNGSVRSAGTITTDPGVTITGSRSANTPLGAPRQHRFTVEFPAPTGSVTVPFNGSRVLTPGSYSQVNVRFKGTLTLTAGTYHMVGFDLDDHATLRIDTSGGPVLLHVKDSIDLDGLVEVPGDSSKFLLGYFGSHLFWVNTRFRGTIIAPYAEVDLDNVGTPGHEGSFFAKELEVDDFDTAMTHRPFSGWTQVLGGADATDCVRSVQMLAAGRNGHSAFLSGDDRTMRYTAYAGDMALIEEAGKGWGEDIRATAVAWGDLDGDGKDELAIGRSEVDGMRLAIHDDRDTGFAELAQLLDGWGDDFRVTAIAFGDIDNDGKLEIAVGRNASQSGIEVALLDDQSTGFQQIREIQLGDRTAHDLTFANVDADARVELLIARGGHSGSAPGRIVVVQDASEGFAESSFAAWADEDRAATEVAVGDLEGDGSKEIAVGRSDGDGGRIQLWRFNPATNAFENLSDWGHNWGSDRYVTALEFGDVDGDGDDELVVGRNGGCGSCPAGQDPRVMVFDDPIVSGAPTSIAGLATGWGSDRGTTALAVGNFDGDDASEIAVGRSEGDNDRIIVHDDLHGGFAEKFTMGRRWGDDRDVQALAASKEKVCVYRLGKPMPQTVAEANAQLDARRNTVIEATVNAFRPQLSGDPSTLKTRLLGDWNGAGDKLSLVLGGLAAIELGLPDATALLNAGFAEAANDWMDESEMTEGVGTEHDFDFDMMAMLSVLYRFKDTRDPRNPNQFLVTNEAVRGLLLHQRPCPVGTDDLDPVLIPPGLPVLQTCSLPLAGSADVHKMMDIRPFPEPNIPETENHVLMVNTWSYLANQWVMDNPRQDAVIQTFRDAHASALQNAGSKLEEGMLAFLGRVVHNDLWETNSRAYQAFSLRPILLLASYANDGPVKEAAKNALDFLATKFAFQSHAGRRYTPMRRNYKYKDRAGLAANDYTPNIFGVLTGATLHDTSANCSGLQCTYREGQRRRFALAAILANYRVHPLIHDFMLRPDNHQPGFGAWSRMQARYTERHYLLSKFPRYLIPGPGDQVDLNQQMRDLSEGAEPAPEFYFLTRSYLNSAGGRHEEYHGFPGSIFTGDDIERQVDVVTKPTALIAGGDLGYWGGPGGAEQDVLVLRGAHHDFWTSRGNTGVYKNFAIGYDTVREGSPFQLPVGWRLGPQATLGGTTLAVVDSTTTGSAFPAMDQFIVIGQLPRQNNSALGFWEVVPRRLFANEQALLDRVVALNSANNLSAGAPLAYTLVVSSETLTINEDYPGNVSFPFSAINGNPQLVTDHHVRDLSTIEINRVPLIDVKQVDANYAFTGVQYAISHGFGLVTITNPCLGKELVLDSVNHMSPTRTENTIPNPAGNAECVALRQAGP